MGEMPRWKLFTAGGHTVYLEPWFLLLVAFFVFSGLTSTAQFGEKLLWAPILFVGVLWHEFGHAIAIKRLGYGNSIIVLQGLGGVTINNRRNTPPGKSALISVAGPVFSLSLTAVFGVAAFLYPGEDLLNTFFTLMAMANAFWGLFNLLPIAPLDGGHIVLHGLRAKFPEHRAYLYSAYSSLAVMAILAVPLSFVLSPFFAVLLALMFVMHNVRVIQALR